LLQVRELHRQKTVMTGWSPFKTAIGSMYVEMGLKGGVEGKLFDISVEQVRPPRDRASQAPTPCHDPDRARRRSRSRRPS